MISKRTLENWRREALSGIDIHNAAIRDKDPEALNIDIVYYAEFNQRILRLTQELLDLSLLKKGK